MTRESPSSLRPSTEEASLGAEVSTAVAPGKLILMGEHAAVYGYPAVVAAFGLEAKAVAEFDRHPPGRGETTPPLIEAEIEVVLPDLDIRVRTGWSAIDDLRDAAASQSRLLLAGKGKYRSLEALGADVEGFSSAGSMGAFPTATLFVLAALGEVCADWSRDVGSEALNSLRRQVLSVTVASEIPMGAGCGSSAAVACTVVAALDQAFLRLSEPHDQGCVGELLSERRERWQEVALQVERYQHGRPSGVDTAAVFRGGVLRAQRTSGELHLRSLDLPDESAGVGGRNPLSAMSVVFTGRAAEPTGTVVASVADALKSEDHAPGGAQDEVQDQAQDQAEQGRVAALLEHHGGLSDRLVRCLEAGEENAIGPILKEGQRNLEKLGVVPSAVRSLVRELESRGVFAKVSGAGSLGGPGAGALLVYDPGQKLDWKSLNPSVLSALPDMRHLNGSLGACGLRYWTSPKAEEPTITD